jgi:tetratricopeptide (TPR) repeat protein
MSRSTALSRFRMFLAPLLTLAFCVLPARAQPLFWETEFSRALDIRDSFYRSAGIDSAAFASMPREVRRSRSFPAADTASPWLWFLKGLACVKDSPETASACFTKALSATDKDPGQTFVLALEFGRCNQPFWQEKSLKKLTVLFLMTGAQSAPILSQTLLFAAQGAQSQFLLPWVAAFDRHCIWPLLLSIKRQGILDTPRAFALFRELTAKIASSWELQLDLARQWYRLLYHICLFLVFGTFVGIAVKYLPQALHATSELLPGSYRLKAKFALAVVLYSSFFFLGILPFLWISYFLLWRHIRARDKTLMGMVLALIVLYPLHVRIADMLETCSSPKSPVMLMRKALDEGYYPALDSSIGALVEREPGDVLAQTAAAIINLKKGDVAAANPHVRCAQQLSPKDPAVIVTAGNALYAAGDLAGARAAYQECVTLYPSYEPAYFNLGQYYFNSMETAKGMEYITKAAKINPALINAFIKTNDESFSKDWPLVRQLIQPDYTPEYFWKTIFPRFGGGTWATANARFGADFLGVSLPAYGCASLFLFVVLMLLDALVWSKDTVRRIYICKLCQTPICRKCKRGGICQDCFNSTQHIRNENIRQRIMAKIQFRSRQYHVIVATLLDAVFPGSGMLYATAPLYRSLPVCIATSVVYGSYLTLAFPSLEFPAWLLHGTLTPVLCACLIYNAVFLGRALFRLVNELKPRGE